MLQAFLWTILGLGVGLLVGRTRWRAVNGQSDQPVASGEPPPTELADRLRRLGQLEQRVLSQLLAKQSGAVNPNQSFDSTMSLGQRLADRVAQFGGSWTFIGLFGVAMVSWMGLNVRSTEPFDPYPFILLNLVLSCLAAMQAPIIMMSQNRQAVKDRSDAQHDYEVNVRAEMEIMALHTKVDLLREQEWLRLVSVVERQQELLEGVARRLDVPGGTGEALPR